jgi:hypothetical protein
MNGFSLFRYGLDAAAELSSRPAPGWAHENKYKCERYKPKKAIAFVYRQKTSRLE